MHLHFKICLLVLVGHHGFWPHFTSYNVMNNLDIGGLSCLYVLGVPTMNTILHLMPFGLDYLLLLASHVLIYQPPPLLKITF
jgi:hypothetical protein